MIDDGKSNEDRRRSPRISIDVVVNCDEENIGSGKDLNETGMCIYSKSHFDIGTYVNLAFELEKGNPLLVCGKVIWIKEVGDESFAMGVEFWHPISHTVNSIRRFVESRI